MNKDMRSGNANKKGITFVPTGAVSEEAKLKLNALMIKKKERLNKLVEDYNAGNFVMQ